MAVMHDLLPQPYVHAGLKDQPRVTAHLTDLDRRALEAHLHRSAVARDADPLLAGILRQKIAWACLVGGAVPPDLATGGRRVTYVAGHDGPRHGLLTHSDKVEGAADAIPVRSLLGATLIGMRVHQRAPLLRDDGTIVTVTLHDVFDPV
jgi:hypothetical protein